MHRLPSQKLGRSEALVAERGSASSSMQLPGAAAGATAREAAERQVDFEDSEGDSALEGTDLGHAMQDLPEEVRLKLTQHLSRQQQEVDHLRTIVASYEDMCTEGTMSDFVSSRSRRSVFSMKSMNSVPE